jgi:hypothetical protein
MIDLVVVIPSSVEDGDGFRIGDDMAIVWRDNTSLDVMGEKFTIGSPKGKTDLDSIRRLNEIIALCRGKHFDDQVPIWLAVLYLAYTSCTLFLRALSFFESSSDAHDG